MCYPKLVEENKKENLTLQINGSQFTFIHQYMYYTVASETIVNRAYTDLEQLSFIMIVLKSDGRFYKDLCQLRIQKKMFEKISKNM